MPNRLYQHRYLTALHQLSVRGFRSLVTSHHVHCLCKALIRQVTYGRLYSLRLFIILPCVGYAIHLGHRYCYMSQTTGCEVQCFAVVFHCCGATLFFRAGGGWVTGICPPIYLLTLLCVYTPASCLLKTKY